MIKGGTVIDPTQNLHVALDVAVKVHAISLHTQFLLVGSLRLVIQVERSPLGA
jgi:hypothetical protein